MESEGISWIRLQKQRKLTKNRQIRSHPTKEPLHREETIKKARRRLREREKALASYASDKGFKLEYIRNSNSIAK